MVSTPDAYLPWSHDVGRAARVAIRDRLDRVVPPNVLEDLELVATELATNAFVHAPPLIDDRIRLRVEVEDEIVRVVAIDGGRDFVPEWDLTPGRTAGGLRVVDALAQAWGVSDDGANAVWAEVAWVPGVVRSRDGA